MNSTENAILLTGGSGFLGFNLAKKLNSLGCWKVICLVHPESKNHLKLQDLANVQITTLEKLNSVSEGLEIQHIIHCATDYGRKLKFEGNLQNPSAFLNLVDANYLLPIQLLQFGYNKNIKSFINFDSYFNKAGLTYLTLPEYASSKRSLVPWLEMYSNKFQVLNLQLEHLYGPGDSLLKFIPSLIDSLLQNKEIIDLTKGEQVRDFIYVDDVVAAVIAVVNHENKSLLDNKRFVQLELGTGFGTTIAQIANLLHELTGSNSKLEFGKVAYREDEIMTSISDGSFQKVFDWAPEYNIHKGFAKYLEILE